MTDLGSGLGFDNSGSGTATPRFWLFPLGYLRLVRCAPSPVAFKVPFGILRKPALLFPSTGI